VLLPSALCVTSSRLYVCLSSTLFLSHPRTPPPPCVAAYRPSRRFLVPAFFPVFSAGLSPLSRACGPAAPRALHYADLGGVDEVLSDIRELIEYPLKHPEVYRCVCACVSYVDGVPGGGEILISSGLVVGSTALK
jgi:hypothetical protein